MQKPHTFMNRKTIGKKKYFYFLGPFRTITALYFRQICKSYETFNIPYEKKYILLDKSRKNSTIVSV